MKTKTKKKIAVLLVLCLLFNSILAFAATNDPAPSSPTLPSGNMGPINITTGGEIPKTVNPSTANSKSGNDVAISTPISASASTPTPTPTPTKPSSPSQLPSYGQNNDTFSSLGFDPKQQSRVDPDGNTLDKNTNPFGSSSKRLVKQLSIACAGETLVVSQNSIPDSNYFGIYSLNDHSQAPQSPYVAPVYYKSEGLLDFNNNKLKKTAGNAISASDLSTYLYDKRNIMGSADMNGDGFEEILNVVLEQKAGTDLYQMRLALVEPTADRGGICNISTQIIDLPVPAQTLKDLVLEDSKKANSSTESKDKSNSMLFKKHFRMAVCKGKLAILANRTLYDFRISKKGTKYVVEKLRECTFNESNKRSPISDSDLPIIDLKADDTNDDGLSELLVTTGSAKSSKDLKDSNLLIYPWEQLTQENLSVSDYKDFDHPEAVLKLYNKNGQGEAFAYAGITMGNISGKSRVLLMGGYTDNGTLAFLPISYDRITKSYQYGTMEMPRNLDGKPIIRGANEPLVVPEMVCASLNHTEAGASQLIAFNTKLFRYGTDSQGTSNAKNIRFIQDISEKSYNKASLSVESNPVIYDTFAGKFDGKNEQIFMLYQGFNGGYGTILINTELPAMDKYPSTIDIRYSVYFKDGTPFSDNAVISRNRKQFSNYPAYCATSYEEKTCSLKFKDAYFAMSDPKIIAVLSAPPYYKELASEYGGGLGNATTVFGTSKTKETERNGSFSVNATATIGFETEISAGLIVNEKIASFETTFSASTEFTSGWSKSSSYTTSTSFSAVGEDMVVLTSVPYDVYQFEIVDPGKDDDGKLMQVCIPYAPQLSQMNLSDYNQMVDKVNSENNAFLPRVSESILNHTVGDPRTYGSTVSDGIGARNIIKGESPIGVGTGDGVSSQSITVSKTSANSFESAFGMELAFRNCVFGVIVGGAAATNWSSGMSVAMTNAQDISGASANLPRNRSNYYYQWQLVGFKCPVSTGDYCYVVNYLVRPQGIVPPPPPSNITVLKSTNTSVTLGWDRVEKAKKYNIYRSTSKDIDMSVPYDTIKATSEAPVYTDTKLIPKKTYYYSIIAVSDTAGTGSEPFVFPIKVKGIEVKDQPMLTYSVGDPLDLSTMTLEITYTDGTTSNLLYKDFYKRGIIINVQNHTILSKDDDDLSIIITDPLTGFTTVSDPLVVKGSGGEDHDTANASGASNPTFSTDKVGSSTWNVKSSFIVGGIPDAKALAPSVSVEAATTIQNKLKSDRSIIVVIAEYNGEGSMVKMDYRIKKIPAGATETVRAGGFLLPWNTLGHVVKVFVVEGDDFDTSSLIPVAPIEQIQ